jgi:hypothetical protein
VTGPIPFSAVLDDMGEVFLATRKEGHWQYRSREDLGIPRIGTSAVRPDNTESGG